MAKEDCSQVAQRGGVRLITPGNDLKLFWHDSELRRSEERAQAGSRQVFPYF